ncbi:hypothetical protein TSL6_15190 [Sulfurovum sp. TSL6]|uniref:hypothetical protein n=1 Tax=Sulfurovum sp. TSL6 TaxID=2826995 RepID=UPI001CC3FADC|nr:hypothetical protein [Sulfurovum sp. TSL6]GIU01013.1 hypothetical protein TSL6_15190 [Sulfurovum sp. TSL6]
MKKTLLLSVVASTMIMAGGDIAPVEPVVEAPAAAAAWEFSGNAVVYYQTDDAVQVSGLGATGGDLFDQDTSAADAGIQLRAANKDVVAGIGAGFAVNGLSTLNLENTIVSNTPQGTGNGDIDDMTDGGWIAEAYLTYEFGNTGIKAGRQTLPQSLSPFAYSENWNVFANTFDAVTVVNTDISNTTIVGGWIAGANTNAWGATNNITDFNSLNDEDGVWMITAQNKSIENLTLTGTYYFGSDMAVTATGTDDLSILWGDAAYDAGSFGVAIQGGQVDAGSFAAQADDMTAFGAKLTGTVSGINLMGAYSTVSDGAMGQIGGSTSALYTNTVIDQLVGREMDEDKFVVGANMDALGGNIAAAYANVSADKPVTNLSADSDEIDVVYATNLTDSLGLTAAYVYYDADDMVDSVNLVRIIANYNF